MIPRSQPKPMVHPSIWGNSIVLVDFLFELVRDVQSGTEVIIDRHGALVQKPVLLTPCYAHLAGHPWDKGDEFSSVSLDLQPYSSEDKWAFCIVGQFVLWFWWKLKINGKQCSEAGTTERPSFLFSLSGVQAWEMSLYWMTNNNFYLFSNYSENINHIMC